MLVLCLGEAVCAPPEKSVKKAISSLYLCFININSLGSNATIIISFATFFLLPLPLLHGLFIICALVKVLLRSGLKGEETTIFKARICRFCERHEGSRRNYARMLNWGNEVLWATFIFSGVLERKKVNAPESTLILVVLASRVRKQRKT